MLLFSGTYKYSLDEKNRLIIPVKFREILSAEGVDKLYITRGDNHLYVFPLPIFLKLSDKFEAWDFTKEANQDYVRRFFSDAFDVAPDKQGRIMLPKEMCAETGIDREAIIIGALNRMEIWPPDKWKEFREKSTLRGFSANLDAHSRE
ncbi:MAG: division/cell wall cluster transcriptional repressor MraZ [Candidatus Abyssobacteria bacterium SURF_17]|uniref:Transcriptional regulator MraZ n=1 Tax=Candidatus Abyssobacteria bacterium SURF_17 TaxID=2093361 RepID=A0A419F7R5_9BACT|nr:MAG: division/cell wall cluster transcriptional repressor MraZ [Candidatus Abyssubacteria bacterium SURF_17]